MSTLNSRVRFAVPVIFLLAAIASLSAPDLGVVASLQGTPAGSSCEMATPGAGIELEVDTGTPMAGMDHGDMDMAAGTPMAGTATDTEFDRLYIDMMAPHHGSIVAMASVALPRLDDERLRVIAQRIISTQSAEQAELMGYREQFYGSPDPAALDAPTMELMMVAMPGMGSMDEMMFQMDAAAQVAAICAADDTDLTFIDLAIPHHEMAITASETALTEAVNPEIAAFAQRVIDDQSAEIEELTAIRAEIAGATPQAWTGFWGRLAA